MGPRIFVSAATSELKTARQLVANALSRLGYEPVWQDIFGTEPGDLRQVLRQMIDGCDGLIQLVGDSYGAEPPTIEPEFAAAGFSRVSYTQFEFLYARARRKKTWLIYTDEGCTRDHPLAELDRPRDPNYPDPAGYQSERHALQETWRQRWKQEGHLRHGVSSDTELELKVERLKDEFAELRRGFRRWQQRVLAASLVAIVLIVAVLVGVAWTRRDLQNIDEAMRGTRRATEQGFAKTESQLQDIKEQQSLTVNRIRRHLIESSEQTRERALAAADREPRIDDRERLRDVAEKEHAGRLSRIDEIAARFAELEKQADSTEEFREMARILTEESEQPIEKALAYAEKRRETRWERVRARKLSEQQRNRADLQIDLQSAALEANNGHSADARRLYEMILQFEPDWPDVLESYAWFLYYESLQIGAQSAEEGIAHARRAFELATRLAEVQSKSAAPSVLSIARLQYGSFLGKRRQSGDAEEALKLFTRSLEESELRLAQSPDSTVAQRDVSMSLYYLSGQLAARDQPGDLEQALKYSLRDVEFAELLFSKNPESARTARNVCVSLSNAADLLLQRGQSVDTEQAITYCERALKVSDQLLARNAAVGPNAQQSSSSIYHLGDLISARGAEDEVSSNLVQLGNVLLERDHAGDAERALKYFLRDLEIGRRLLEKAPDSAQAAGNVMSCLNRLGHFYESQDQPADADTAVGYYQQALEIGERVLPKASGSAMVAREFLYSLHHAGDVLAERHQSGDVALALSYYQRSMEFSEAELLKAPDSDVAARHVYSSLYRLGDVLASRGQSGDFEQAKSHYQRAVTIAEGLLANTPDSVADARNVAFSLNRLGDLQVEHGEPADVQLALANYQRSLEVSERILAKTPESAYAVQLVSRCLHRIADLLAGRNSPGDLEQAIHHLRRGVEIGDRLAAPTSNPAAAQRDTALCLYHLGGLLIHRDLAGDAKQGRACYQRYTEICEHQFQQAPGLATALDLVIGHDRLGDCEVRQDRFADAIVRYQKALQILDQAQDSQQSSRSARLERTRLRNQIKYCQQAYQSIGDWEILLKDHFELIPTRLSLLAKRGKLDELAQAGAKLRQLADLEKESAARQKKGELLQYATIAYELCAQQVEKKAKPNGPAVAGKEQGLSDKEQAAVKSYRDLSQACSTEAIATGFQRKKVSWNPLELLSPEENAPNLPEPE